jgi:molybdopterin synthase catalytic subunit
MPERLSAAPLDAEAVAAEVRAHGHGAVLVFEGVVRASGGPRPDGSPPGAAVRALEYEAWEPVAERELDTIVAEVAARWPEAAVAVRHRLGRVSLGEPAVVVAVGAPHRDTAYAASRHVIDTLKERVPIWKKELYDDGSAWVSNRP